MLWAPWRMDYILQDKPGSGCVFCPSPQVDKRTSLIVCATELSIVMLNKYPYNSGHLMVAPKKHTAKLEELTALETADVMSLVQLSTTILTEELNPEGFNIGMNIGRSAGAGIADHLHMHVVPRWQGDTNFMPVLADTHIVPEHLDATQNKLSKKFEEHYSAE